MLAHLLTHLSPHPLTQSVGKNLTPYVHIIQEQSDTRLAVQEALSMMAPSYKNADSTILALIEALILNYVQQVSAEIIPCKFMHIILTDAL